MEKAGAVNCYVPYQWEGMPIYTINLANGVTPFMHFFDGKEYSSECYRLGKSGTITVTHAHYRPRKEEFDALTKEVQEHILNGGLLVRIFDDQARLAQLTSDPVVTAWTYEQFQEWCLRYYGKRLGPLEN